MPFIDLELHTLPSYTVGLLEEDLNMDDSASIRNLLSLYAIMLDTKGFDQLSRAVFVTTGATADFTAIGMAVITGEENIIEALRAFLKNVDTQHQIGTTRIMLPSAPETASPGDQKTAKAVSYVQAQHFGRDKLVGERWDAWARYDDDLVQIPNLIKEDMVVGSAGWGNGGWRIKTRVIGLHVSIPSGPISVCTLTIRGSADGPNRQHGHLQQERCSAVNKTGPSC